LAARPEIRAGSAVWVHAASAGELLQAQPLLAALTAVRPRPPLVYTYTSPSAEPLLGSVLDADLVVPLPLDTRRNAADWIDAVRPRALALVDAELWPNLLRECCRRGILRALVSARVGPASRRARVPWRYAYRTLLRELDVVACADADSATRLLAIGARRERVHVTGDLRVDATLQRAASGEPPPALPFPGDHPVVVAGSTWPDDEAVLLPALRGLRDRSLATRLVIAPHEGGEARLSGVERSLARWGFTAVRLSRLAAESSMAQAADAVLVDRTGQLYRLYGAANLAWVGGGFRGALHSVMEPAAFGVPVVTGPATGGSWFAGELRHAGALFPVRHAREAEDVMGALLASRARRDAAGAAARAVLESYGGATERTVAVLMGSGWLDQAGMGDPAGSTYARSGTRSI
ncbi:MAG: hypothetical protein H0V09_07075, partial [Gemmatimonadetes bacterium]|nr:hypothetical protein [Gemmatimonadota bacterium]